MLFVIFLALILVAAAVHVGLTGEFSFARANEIFLLYLLVGYYGFSMLFGAYVHLSNPEALDAYKGWPFAGKPMHTLYAAALIGVAVASILCIWFHGTYVLGPAIAGALLSFGGAYLHINEIVLRGFIARKDVPEILFDVVVPLVVLTLAIAHVMRLGKAAMR